MKNIFLAKSFLLLLTGILCFGIQFSASFAQQIALPNSCFDSSTIGWTRINGGNGLGTISADNRSKSQCSGTDSHYLKWTTFSGSSLRNASLPYPGPGTYTAGAYMKRPTTYTGIRLNFRIIVLENGSIAEIADSDTIIPGGGWGNGSSGYFTEQLSLSHVCAGSCEMHFQFKSHDDGIFHLDSITLEQSTPALIPIPVSNPCFELNANDWVLDQCRKWRG